MVVITNIYRENHRTKRMVDSFTRFGYEVAVSNANFPHGRMFKDVLKVIKRASTGHDKFVYSDGGDTICQRAFDVPDDRLIWSTEKQCYPFPDKAAEYKFPPNLKSPWRYLNNGGYGGSLKLMVEFIDSYGLEKIPDSVTAQAEVMDAYIKAKAEGFPIELDYKCKLFQSIAFDPMKDGRMADHFGGVYNGTDFEIKDGLVHNRITKTTPAILHGNGQTPMEWIYRLQ